MTRDKHMTTNRSAVPPGATASSAYSALSLAADVVSVHASQTVAAHYFGHIKNMTAEIGSHTSGRETARTYERQQIRDIGFSHLDRAAGGTIIHGKLPSARGLI